MNKYKDNSDSPFCYIMDTLLQRYMLDKAQFLAFLKRDTILLSGSSALACYLEQHGIESGFNPNDLDIWVSYNDLQGEEDLIDFIRDSGYNITKISITNDIYMQRLTHIAKITTLERDGQYPNQSNKIQVIRITYLKSLMEYVVAEFDFSVCMTWWNSELESFETVYPSLTLKKQTFIRNSFLSMADSERKRERLQKYTSRGFTVVDEPPPFWTESDLRTDDALMPWKEINGFDVFEYEDVSIWNHLRASEWNIVLGVGSSWYVFDRKRITEYMKEKRHIDPVWGKMYDTPFRQTIHHDAWNGLFYSDHSIFVLVSPEVHTFRGSTKTLYDVEAYSTLDWSRSIVSYLYDKRNQQYLDSLYYEEDEKQNSELNQDEIDIVQLISSSINISEEELLADNDELFGINLLNGPPPAPDIPLSPIQMQINNPPQFRNELYYQMLEWIQYESDNI